MSRVIVVGQNPASDAIYTVAPKNTTHDTLGKWMTELGVEQWSFVNAWQRPGACALCDVDAAFLKEATAGYMNVLALGNLASLALKRAGIPHVKMPHPSPRNRMHNDPELIRRALADVRERMFKCV